MFDFLKKSPEKISKNYRDTGLNSSPSSYGWYTCVGCGRKFRKNDIDIDHIVPQSKGGSNNADNLQCLCIRCNRSKGNRMTDTKADLIRRKEDLKEKQRQVYLQERLNKERANLRNDLRSYSDSDLRTLLRDKKLQQNPDSRKYLQNEARRRGIIN